MPSAVAPSHSPLMLDSVESSIVAQFERQVDASPDYLAVATDERQFTYAALNAAAAFAVSVPFAVTLICAEVTLAGGPTSAAR